MSVRLHSSHASHVGRVRENNEDSLLDRPGLYAVADGMGGHAAGEIASQIAIQTLAAWFEISTVGETEMRDAFAAANARILENARLNRDREGMGTTLTALAFSGDLAVIGHVGDSRCYLVRDGAGKQLTRDHTVAAAYEEATGQRADPLWKSQLGNCLGAARGFHVKTDARVFPCVPGDVLVLCTDGIADYADAGDVARIARGVDSDRLAMALVEQALARGGHDNATAVVIEVE